MNEKKYDKMLLDFIKENNPDNLETCIYYLKRSTDLSIEESKQIILELIDDKKITIEKDETYADNFLSYVISLNSLWFLSVMITSTFLLSILSIYRVSLWPPFRIIFGSIYLFFLPGYSIYKLIFTLKENDLLEIIFSSLAISITFVPLLGYLYFISTGSSNFFPFIYLLYFFTLITGALGKYKEYRTLRGMPS